MNTHNVEHHKEDVHKVISRFHKYGLYLKESKCDFFIEKIKYLGHITDKDRRRLELGRATAIKNMSAPEKVSSSQSFLGLANYYQVFILNMHNLRVPLKELLKKDKNWEWIPKYKVAFVKIKVLTSDLFLTHNNSDLDITVASDASSYGRGAFILHKMPDGSPKPVAHASSQLLPAEKNYTQIEKESLGIFIVVVKFHRYIHGRYFTFQMDHKSLLTIFGSKIDCADGEQSSWIITWSSYRLKNTVMPTDFQINPETHGTSWRYRDCVTSNRRRI